MTRSLGSLSAGAIAELGAALAKVDAASMARVVDAIDAANTIALHGVGREGLMMRALTMRLFHMGLDAHVVGDMTTPPLGAGDLLVVSAGPGAFATVAAFVAVAKDAGAGTLCVTAQPGGAVPQACDFVLTLPAQTMADDGGGQSVLPMGSLFEGVQYLAFELLVLMLRDKRGVTAEAMRARHTNLE